MRNEDDIIREALELDVNVPDGLNNRILHAVDRKKRNNGFLRAAATVATCILVLFGTVTAVDAATGGKIADYFKGKIESFIYGNGSHTAREGVQKNGEQWERVIFIEDGIVFSHPVSEDAIEYNLYLKVAGSDGYDHFISLSAAVEKDAPAKELYYIIRGNFLESIGGYQGENEKQQILAALKEAAASAETEAVKEALTDVAQDYANNRKIFFKDWPGAFWGEENNIILFEDITDLPTGDIAVIVNPVDETQKSWMAVIRNDDSRVISSISSGSIYSEESLQEIKGNGIPVYDLRKTK